MCIVVSFSPSLSSPLPLLSLPLLSLSSSSPLFLLFLSSLFPLSLSPLYLPVGHCHPKVVKACSEQMAKVCCNPFPNHHLLEKYTSHLLTKFPDKLDFVFYTNSGYVERRVNWVLMHKCVTMVSICFGLICVQTAGVYNISLYPWYVM